MNGRTAAAVVLAATMVVGALGGIVIDRSLLLPHRIGTRPWGPRGGGGGGGGGGPRGPGGGRGWPGQEQAMRDRLARELDLSDEQRTKLDSVMTRQMFALREARDQMQPRMDSIVRQTRAAVDSLLTPAQRALLEQMRDRNFFGLPYPPGPHGGGAVGESAGFRRRGR